MLSILSDEPATKSKSLTIEPFGQRLSLLSTASALTCVDGYTASPLPCINERQTAAKIIAKDQQTLRII